MKKGFSSFLIVVFVLISLGFTGCSDSDDAPSKTWYKDADGDKYSDGTSQQSVSQPNAYYEASALKATSGDCNDNDVKINPASAERCGDGIDQDCDGKDSECPKTWYKDADGDKYSDGTSRESVTQPDAYYETSALKAISGDCNDNDVKINPASAEICGDGIDQNCDGNDAACPKTWYKDADADGYSDGTSQQSVTQPNSYYEASALKAISGDCNDNDVKINPASSEICGDNIDQDCDGNDSACPKTWYKDADGDKYSDGTSQQSVTQPESYYEASVLKAVSGDCNDSNVKINPASAEICGDGIDQDCDGKDSACPKVWYKDTDGDRYSDGIPQQSVSQPIGYYEASTLVSVFGDCNDNNISIYPGSPEICGDGIDQDCDGKDSVCPKTWYKDVDGDKYSDGTTQQSANQPTGYYEASALTATTGDCNDSESNIHPAAAEICGDSIDQNCDGKDSVCLKTWFKDADSDGYSDGTSQGSATQPDGYYEASSLAAISGDCNDSELNVNPGATEICGDEVDQDCDGNDIVCENESPRFPGIVLINAIDTDKVILAWLAASDSSTAASDMTYEIHLSRQPAFEPSTATLYKEIKGKKKAEVTGLNAGTTYHFLVVAVNEKGNRSTAREYRTVTTFAEPVILNDAANLHIAEEHGLGEPVQDGNIYTYKKTADAVPPEIGSILIGQAEDGGYLTSVESVHTTDNEIIVETGEATLSDVLKQGTIRSNITLFDVEESVNQSGKQSDSINARSAKSDDEEEVEEKTELEYDDEDGLFMAKQTTTYPDGREIKVGAGGEFIFKPTVKFAPELITDVSWSESGITAEVRARGTLSLDVEAEFNFKASGEYSSKEYKLWERTFKSVYLVAGVPVYREVILAVNAQLSVGAGE